MLFGARWQCPAMNQTAPRGQYIRSKLARRVSKSGINWPEGPVHQYQTGLMGEYIRTKLVRRAADQV